MNTTQTQDKRTILNELLNQLTHEQREIFKGQYSPTNPFAELRDIVANMHSHQLDAAFVSAKRQLK